MTKSEVGVCMAFGTVEHFASGAEIFLAFFDVLDVFCSAALRFAGTEEASMSSSSFGSSFTSTSSMRFPV